MSAFTLADAICTLAEEITSAEETLQCLRMRRQDIERVLLNAAPATPSFYTNLEAWQKINRQVEDLEARYSNEALTYQLQQLIDEYAREGVIT